MVDSTKLIAIRWLIERAKKGDKAVLHIAREKAAGGNKFAQGLLKSLGKEIEHE